MNKFISGKILPDKLIEKYMSMAIEEAKAETEKTSSLQEVPVGCIIVDKHGQITAKAHNTRENSHLVTGHAEINAMNKLSAETGDFHLKDSVVFVTLEPCPMCAGALAAARPKAVYYGTPNTLNGSCGTVYNILGSGTDVFGGIRASEISDMLSSFFSEKRK